MSKALVLFVACLPVFAQQVPPQQPGPDRGRFIGRRGAQAAQPQPAGPPGSVRGQVISTAGEPLRKVEITLRSQGSAYSATTDAAGVFSLEGVFPGNYTLVAQRNGYVRQETGATTRPALPPVVVGPGQAVTGVIIKLAPHSVITGRVVDEDGEPMARVSVQVQRERWNRGQRQLLMVSNGSANDLGEYRVAGLPSGRYYVVANAGRNFGGERPRSSNSAPETGYTATFYPNTTDSAQAVPIEIAAGQEARGIDFQLRKIVTYRIRGRVVDPAAAPGRNMTIAAMPSDTGSLASTRGVAPDGTFELAGIRPGIYTLIANRMDRQSGRSTSTQQVTVGNRDLDGIVMTLAPPVDIPVSVRAEGDAPVDLNRLRVALESTSPSSFLWGGNRATAVNGALVVRGVSSGKYRVNVSGLPDGSYVKSIKQGSQEVLNAGLTVAGPGGAIEIMLGMNAPVISGTVQDSNGKPVPGMAVALIPDPPLRDQYQLYSQVATGDIGTFTLRNLTPGDYKAFVLADSEAESIQNPAFIAQRENRAVSIRLTEGKMETMQLTVKP